jgi:hypothetical protein
VLPLFNALTFIIVYVNDLSAKLKILNSGSGLSRKQKIWLSFVLSAVLVSNSICWSYFERMSNKKHKACTLLGMFRRPVIAWSKLMTASVGMIIERYKLKEGVLLVDDTDKSRSKNVKKLHAAHKVKDKATDGYSIAQNVMFLVLVTDRVTIPLGFAFYEPDAEWVLWRKEDKKLKKDGIPKKDRPKEPAKNTKNKREIAVGLVRKFQKDFPDFKIRSICADCYFGNKAFSDGIHEIYNNVQIISQIRGNQIVYMKGKPVNVSTLFERYAGGPEIINCRGESKNVIMYGMRIKVKSYGHKLFVIALKYEGEDEYRYITATDLSWRAIDIVSAYTLRWLVEVFIQDWKGHMGFDSMAIHQGVDGSFRGLTLSLLADHALNFHPEQAALIDAKLPAGTVSSLTKRIKIEALLESIKTLVYSDQPKDAYEKMADSLMSIYELNSSKRNMVNVDMKQYEGKAYLAAQFKNAA